MTEETTQENQVPDNNVNISLEQILAAVLNATGPVTIALDQLIANYNNKQIAVNQNEDKSVVFSLVDAPQPSDAENSSDITDSAE